MTARLALFGGFPAVTAPLPHQPWPLLTAESRERVIAQMDSGQLSLYGRSGVVAELEDHFAERHGMKYAVATNSGTTALHSAYFGLGLGPGDEVLAPTYTFLATVTPILHVNAVPVLCDADPTTGNIALSSARRRVTRRTRAIVVTHMWGHPAEMDEVVAFAAENGLRIVEDCSHAHFSTYKGRLVGTFGDVACFSLQGNKLLSAGEGGILLTNDQEIYERATLLGHYNVRSKQCVGLPRYRPFVGTGYGLKYRMHPLAAAFALGQLPYADEWIDKRRTRLERMSDGLKPLRSVRAPHIAPHATMGAWYGYKPHYIGESQTGVPYDVYVRALQAEGLEVDRPGSAPLHREPLFQSPHDLMYAHDCPRRCPYVEGEHHYDEADFIGASSFYDNALSIPTLTTCSVSLVDAYVDGFRKVDSAIDELRDYAFSSGRCQQAASAEASS